MLWKIGAYLLAPALIGLWLYGQYLRGKEFYNRDRKSDINSVFSDDKEE